MEIAVLVTLPETRHAYVFVSKSSNNTRALTAAAKNAAREYPGYDDIEARVIKPTPMTDFRITGSGTVYVVTAISEAAQARLTEIIEENEIADYMQLGANSVAVEHRFIETWFENLRSEGFTVNTL